MAAIQKLRGQQGIGVIGWSYPQTGIVATVAHEKPHNGVAYEHFLPSGPFAILPMTENRSSLVWTERADKAPAMLALDEAGFNAEVARRFGDHLGATKGVGFEGARGGRWSYPLSFHLARDFVKPRFALAGDCAHGIHPIAGQGLNLGLKDAAALAETLLDAARLGRDLGALDTLKRYERWRRFDSVALAASTDAMNRLFSNDIAPLRHIRDLGLGIVDAIGPARRFFMRHAGGDIGKLPRLLKGVAAWLLRPECVGHAHVRPCNPARQVTKSCAARLGSDEIDGEAICGNLQPGGNRNGLLHVQDGLSHKWSYYHRCSRRRNRCVLK